MTRLKMGKTKHPIVYSLSDHEYHHPLVQHCLFVFVTSMNTKKTTNCPFFPLKIDINNIDFKCSVSTKYVAFYKTVGLYYSSIQDLDLHYQSGEIPNMEVPIS